MCLDPATIIAAGAQIVSGIQQRQTASERGAIIDQQAKREREVANLEAERVKENNDAALGRQRALLAANGVTLNSGTSIMLQSQSARNANFDERLVRAGGVVRATRLEQQAGLERSSGRGAAIGGAFRAGATLLKTGFTSGRERGTLFG